MWLFFAWFKGQKLINNITEKTFIYFRKNVCSQNNKYGFCRYGRRCDKKHFTDTCTLNENCKEKYCSDKRILTDVTTLRDSKDVNLESIVNICI